MRVVATLIGLLLILAGAYALLSSYALASLGVGLGSALQLAPAPAGLSWWVAIGEEIYADVRMTSMLLLGSVLIALGVWIAVAVHRMRLIGDSPSKVDST